MKHHSKDQQNKYSQYHEEDIERIQGENDLNDVENFNDFLMQNQVMRQRAPVQPANLNKTYTISNPVRPDIFRNNSIQNQIQANPIQNQFHVNHPRNQVQDSEIPRTIFLK